MNVSIEQLNKKWEDLRGKLEIERIKFDNEYREKHKNHECSSKVYSYKGNWFCEHLTKARYNRLKELILKEEKLVCSIINTTN